jgi:hypothetical protein
MDQSYIQQVVNAYNENFLAALQTIKAKGEMNDTSATISATQIATVGFISNLMERMEQLEERVKQLEK